MRANAAEPRPGRCPRCQRRALRVYLPAGRPLLVELAEVDVDTLEPGLHVAVDATGAARSLRWPGELHRGESVHRLHEMSCQR